MIATEGRHLLWTLDARDRPATLLSPCFVVFGMGTWALLRPNVANYFQNEEIRPTVRPTDRGHVAPLCEISKLEQHRHGTHPKRRRQESSLEFLVV